MIDDLAISHTDKSELQDYLYDLSSCSYNYMCTRQIYSFGEYNTTGQGPPETAKTRESGGAMSRAFRPLLRASRGRCPYPRDN